MGPAGPLGHNQSTATTYGQKTWDKDAISQANLESRIVQKREARRLRWRLKDAARELEGYYEAPRSESAKRSARWKCRHTRFRDQVAVVRFESKGSPAGVGLAGVAKCGSIAECPLCAREAAARRAHEIRDVVKRFERDGGGHVYMLTLTIRHGAGDDLAAIRKQLTEAWRRLWGDKRGKLLKGRLELEGSCKALEVTHGRHGFHPHLHALLFCRAELEGTDLRRTTTWITRRWRSITRELELGVPSVGHAVDLGAVCSEGADYIAKMGLADEVTGAIAKGAKNGNRTPWQVLGAYVETMRELVRARDKRDVARCVELQARCNRDAAIWKAYCEGIRGARWLTWSRGFKRRWLIDENRELEASVMATIDGPTWDGLATGDRAAILEVAERDDLDALCRLGAVVWGIAGVDPEELYLSTIPEWVAMRGAPAPIHAPTRSPPATAPPKQAQRAFAW